MAKNKPHKPGAGRPTEYNYETLHKSIEEYLSKCVDEETEFHKTRGDKTDSYDRVIKVKLPSLEGLSLYLNISKDTLYAWKEKYKEFSYDIDRVLKLQAERLIDNGLSGTYNSVITKLLLSKHNYRDSTDITSDGKPIFKPTEEEASAISKAFNNL